jgi:hypothetical protein
MLAPKEASTRIRAVCSHVQPFVSIAPSWEVCVGAPSCSPLLQYELLLAVRERMPGIYAQAGCEFGLYLSRTQNLIDRGIEVISGARAVQLARLIAREPNARDVFGETGLKLFAELKRRCPPMLKAAIRNLPRPMRAQQALQWTRRVAYNFAGSVSRIETGRRPDGLTLSVRRGVFADRPETLAGAREYYRRLFESMFREFAHVNCEVHAITDLHPLLDRCDYQIVWEA